MRRGSEYRDALRDGRNVLPGSSLVVAPSDMDLATPEVAAGLEESFGGGGYTALQGSALLSLAWDHVASALDGRECSYYVVSDATLETFAPIVARLRGR